MATFKELGLNSKIMKSLDDLGFTEPSPVQEKAIPFILKSENDLIALAQTGTGKTAAFGLPILQKIEANERALQAIILCPTRELCIQISRDIAKLAKYSKGITITAVYGGERIDFQIKALKRGVSIVVGTPGRVHDLIRRKILKLQSIKWLVLDEADEMLDMGFKDDLDAILTETPKTRQTLLFSATISKSVRSIAKQYMTDAEEIIVGEQNVGAEKVSHEYYIVGARDRFEALKRILDYLPEVYGILFCRTRRETGEVSDKLKQAGYDTEALHGEISQGMRTKIMDRFKRKQIHLLVATDVAARGIDVSDLSHVINYSLPSQNEAYTHRSGRTGRASKSGVSISILNPRETGKIKRLENIIGKKFEYKKVPAGEDICRKHIDNFFAKIETAKTEEIGNERYIQEFSERLKKISKEDLIKYFIAYKFSSLVGSYKNSRDLNAKDKAPNTRMRSEDGIALKINFGKKHGFDIKAVFALINSNRNLKGIEIGKINLMPEYSVFSVEKKRANEVLRYLKGTNFRGKKIVISKSSIAASYPGNRRGGANRGFRGKRREVRRAR
ncbi:MAG: DEAD/DEAH box helicase [Patescibacteria group bacterium]|nr:DEAD/DEAH box helicase [Patescibacteria group bacterium]